MLIKVELLTIQQKFQELMERPVMLPIVQILPK